MFDTARPPSPSSHPPSSKSDSVPATTGIGPAVRTTHVAAFVCPETERLSREVGFPLAVIAATSDPARHAARLSATMHAALSPRPCEAWPLPFDEGLALPRDLAYRQLAFDGRWLGGAPLPRGVGLDAGSLRVALPAGASAADLSAVLRSALADMAYETVARRPDRVRYRYATNRPVVAAPRYALMMPGDIERVVAVDDLFEFRPCDLATVAVAVSLAVDVLAVSSAWGHATAPGNDAGRIAHV